MSRIIEIHRHLSFAEGAQSDPEVKAWFDGAFRPIGPYFEGKKTATGLSFDELSLLMPDIIGVESDNKQEFRREVRDYFDSILHRVPSNGLKLEIGLENDNLPLGRDNLPLNIKDYVAYRHIKGSPKVAMSLDGAEKDPTKNFYIVDPEEVTSETLKLNALEDEALTQYFQFKDDDVKVDQVLTMMGVNIRGMDHSDKVIKFKSMVIRNENLSEPDQRSAFMRFIDLCKDPDLSMKYMVQELIGAQVLEKVGTAILLKESGQKLGDNLRETIMFLNNDKNSRILNMLKAEYQAKIKFGSSFSPQVVPDNSAMAKKVEKEEQKEEFSLEGFNVKKPKKAK